METIGDAYCVAGGLHKESTTHAQQIAWMALRMIDTCKLHQTHDGQPIRVSPVMIYYYYLRRVNLKNEEQLERFNHAKTQKTRSPEWRSPELGAQGANIQKKRH